jgi:hypothetical protein
MMPTGRCHCGVVRYSVAAEPHYHAVCHCEDCRRCSGAITTAWIAFPAEALEVTAGAPSEYRSSEHGRRHFCGACGTGLFYYNAKVLPGIVDIQSVTLDEPEAFVPQIHIQVADSLGWESSLEQLPRFDRYPA